MRTISARGWLSSKATMKHSTSCFWVRSALFATGLLCISLPAAELLRGPYLQIPTTESITIRWRTDVPTESVVWYGLETNNLQFSASEATLTNEHIVKLSGLTPATQYFYSVGSVTQTLALGIDCRFVTSPMASHPGPTRVWALGDFGGLSMGYEDSRPEYGLGELAVRDSFVQFTATNQADLWLPLGDMAYWGGTDEEFQTNFFWVFDAVLRKLPVLPAIGNHDTYAAPPGQRFPYLDIFSFPTNGEAGGVASSKEEYYSFDRANIHFICLDSMTQSRATDGAMANWLRADLAASTNQWIIAYFHHAPYSKGSHNSDAATEIEMIQMRENFLPILEAGGVDLVLSGHTHVYERSYLLHGHYGYSTNLSPEMILNPGSGRENETGPYTKPTSGPLANRGTVYVVAGSGCCLEGIMGQHPVMHKYAAQLGSLIFEVNSNRLDAVFLRETGAIDDSFTIIKDNPRPLVWSGLTDTTTWNLSLPNWSNTASQINGDSFRIGDHVRFDDSTANRQVNLSGRLTPSSTSVDTAGIFTFAGSGSLSGPTGLNKQGTGTLRVWTTNDYTGPTMVSHGGLNISGGKAIGDASAVLLANASGTSLVINDGETIGSLAGGGTSGGSVTINSGTLTTGGNDDNTSFAGNLSGAGSFGKHGGGALTLNGFTLLLGELVVKSGNLIVDGNGFVSTFGSQRIGADTGDNGVLTLKGSSTYAVASDLNIGDVGNSVGSMFVTNNASLTVTRLFVGAANAPGSSASGTVNQTAGSVTETATSLGDFVIGGRSPDSTNGTGVYNLSGGTLSANSPVVVGDWGLGTLNQSGGTLSAAAAGSGIVVQRNAGPGGTYNLDGGTLKAAKIWTGVVASDLNFNSTFNFNGGLLQATTDDGSFMQALTRANVRDGGAVIDTAGFSITISQPLLQSGMLDDVGTGGLTKHGPGTLTLLGENTYSGGTVLNSGRLNIAADENLGYSTGTLSIHNGATLGCTANLILSSTRRILLGLSDDTVQPDGSRVSAIIDVAAGTTADVRCQILGTNDNGTARLMKTGGGLLFLNNLGFNNAFNGGIYLHGGMTKTAPGPQFGDSILTQDQGAKIISNQDGVFNARWYIGTGGAVRESGLGYTVFRNGPVLNVNNTQSFGGLMLQGDETAGDPSLNAGKVGLGGTNIFGGIGQAVVVNTNFTLSISRDANLGHPANRLVLNHGILAVEHGAASDGTNAAVAVTAVVNTAREIDISGNVTIFVGNLSDPKNNAVAAANNGIPGQMTASGPVVNGPAGPGSLRKTGVGTLTLSGANSYTGNTAVSGGTLALTQPTLHPDSIVTIATGAALRLDFATTNRVAGLVVHGVTNAPGIYNSANSSPYLAGPGSLLVPPPYEPAILTNSINGNILSLSWPAGQNWTLQVQTNSPLVGLSTNWMDVPGTGSLNSANITINPNQPATFYRLRQ